MLASEVQPRVDIIDLYAPAFLILRRGAVSKLNYLQCRWTRNLRGCDDGPHTKWILPVAACGWCARLSSRIKEIAVMSLAPLRLLLADHSPRIAVKAVEANHVRLYASVAAFQKSIFAPVPQTSCRPHVACACIPILHASCVAHCPTVLAALLRIPTRVCAASVWCA